jgi:hypothetical protein
MTDFATAVGRAVAAAWPKMREDALRSMVKRLKLDIRRQQQELVCVERELKARKRATKGKDIGSSA